MVERNYRVRCKKIPEKKKLYLIENQLITKGLIAMSKECFTNSKTVSNEVQYKLNKMVKEKPNNFETLISDET